MTDFNDAGISGLNRALAFAKAAPKSSAGDMGIDDELKAGDIQLQRACSEMESLFLNHLLQKMRATIEKSDFLGGGQTEELYTSMLDGEIARNLARAGGIGLASVLQQQLDMARVSTPGDAQEQVEVEPQTPVKPILDGSENG